MPKKTGFFVDFENFYYEIYNNYKEILDAKASEVAIKIIDEFKNDFKKEEIDILIGHAYGDWEKLSDVLEDLYFLFLTPNFSLCKRGKSSADIELSLDVLEIMLNRSDIDIFIILGGDRDYMPIARRILERGKEVRIACLEKSLSGDLRKNVGVEKCIYLDTFLSKHLIKKSVREEIKTARTLDLETPVSEEIKEINVEARQEEELKEAKETVERHFQRYSIETKREFKEDEIIRCVEKLLEARDYYKSQYQYYGNFKILPFFKDFMNDSFPDMTNIERKQLIHKIREMGIIKTKEVFGDYSNATTVEIIENHPMVQKVKDNIFKNRTTEDPIIEK